MTGRSSRWRWWLAQRSRFPSPPLGATCRTTPPLLSGDKEGRSACVCEGVRVDSAPSSSAYPPLHFLFSSSLSPRVDVDHLHHGSSPPSRRGTDHRPLTAGDQHLGLFPSPTWWSSLPCPSGSRHPRARTTALEFGAPSALRARRRTSTVLVALPPNSSCLTFDVFLLSSLEFLSRYFTDNALEARTGEDN